MQNHKKVIFFPQSGWRFFDYLLGNGNPVEDWHQALSEDGKDIFDSLLKSNQKVHLPIEWGGFRWLQGEYKKQKLWEWKFCADNRQERIVGIFGANRKEAIFLIGCYHKGKIYTPPNALDTAAQRAKEYRAGRASLSERQVEQGI